MGKFKELRVWNDSMELTVKIYEVTNQLPFNRDFGLCNQIRRAACSIVSNIAESDERGTNRESVHFFHIAKGSAAEVITQLNIACRIGYIDEPTLQALENQAERIVASLKNLIKNRGGSNPLNLLTWLFVSLLKPI